MRGYCESEVLPGMGNYTMSKLTGKGFRCVTIRLAWDVNVTEAIKKRMSQTHLVKKLSAMLFFIFLFFSENELSPMRFFLNYSQG